MFHIIEDVFKQLIFLDIQNRAKKTWVEPFCFWNSVQKFVIKSNKNKNKNKNKTKQNQKKKNSTIISGTFYDDAIMDWSTLFSAIKSISKHISFIEIGKSTSYKWNHLLIYIIILSILINI